MKNNSLLFLSYILYFTLFTYQPLHAMRTPEELSYESGLSKLKEIMLNQQTGMRVEYTDNPLDYAEVKNVADDIALTALVKTIGCKTVMCSNFLEETLKHPYSAHAQKRMKERQSIIRLLVENPLFKKEIEEYLVEAEKKEKITINCLSETYEGRRPAHCILANLLGIKDAHSSHFFQLYNYFHIFIELIMEYKIMHTNYSDVTGTFKKTLKKQENQMTSLQAAMYCMKKAFDLSVNFAALTTISSIFEIKNIYTQASDKRTALHSLHVLNSLQEQFKEIYQENHIDKVTHSPLAEKQFVIDQLKHNRYKAEHSSLFMYPLVHKHLYTVYQHESALAPLFISIGEIDALNALATKIIESKEGKDSFCFSEINENSTREIKATDMGNLLIKNPITNTLTEEKNIILTGPNAGGKTTISRTLLQNILLHQAFGVAAGSTFSAPFYDVVHSHLSIQDNIIEGTSRFNADTKVARLIIDTARAACKDNKLFFFALDELFSSTTEKYGEECAYRFIEQLIKDFDNIHFIFATHFESLQKLADKYPDRFTNYKMNLSVDKDYTVKYLYTLSKGKNDINIAIELAKKAGLFDA